MKHTKKILCTMFIFFAASVLTGRKFVFNVALAVTPICGDASARVNENVYCRIEVNNSELDQLTSAHLNIDIPNDVTFIVTDNDWTCTTNVNTVSCDKEYGSPLSLGAFDYINVSFGPSASGNYAIDSMVSGSGINNIFYDSETSISYDELWCGDGECTTGYENTVNCCDDCGGCAVCGDGECAVGSEDAESCYSDCGSCGDGLCTAGYENAATCYGDCVVCGDGTCVSGYEDLGSCAADCSVCGDGECTGGEDVESCAVDCP